jgi:competence protein ComEA
MAQLGAEGSPEEWQLLERYLDAQLALIKINSAPAGELQRTFDVPSAIAEAIVKYRQENGHFDAIEDVKKVPGLDAAKVDARKDRLFF